MILPFGFIYVFLISQNGQLLPAVRSAEVLQEWGRKGWMSWGRCLGVDPEGQYPGEGGDCPDTNQQRLH